MRARLVPVMRLLPINAGRNIMRESDIPITVFFILVGEVQMIKGEDSEVRIYPLKDCASIYWNSFKYSL